MTKHWTKIEPIFLSAVLMLVGWICFETVNHKTDIAVVKEKVNTIQQDISEIQTSTSRISKRSYRITELEVPEDENISVVNSEIQTVARSSKETNDEV